MERSSGAATMGLVAREAVLTNLLLETLTELVVCKEVCSEQRDGHFGHQRAPSVCTVTNAYVKVLATVYRNQCTVGYSEPNNRLWLVGLSLLTGWEEGAASTGGH